MASRTRCSGCWRTPRKEFRCETTAPLVPAAQQPDSLPLEASDRGVQRAWLHTTFAAALSALQTQI
eukprot:2144341-Prorocentrum_lima.AAC.1